MKITQYRVAWKSPDGQHTGHGEWHGEWGSCRSAMEALVSAANDPATKIGQRSAGYSHRVEDRAS